MRFIVSPSPRRAPKKRTRTWADGPLFRGRRCTLSPRRNSRATRRSWRHAHNIVTRVTRRVRRWRRRLVRSIAGPAYRPRRRRYLIGSPAVWSRGRVEMILCYSEFVLSSTRVPDPVGPELRFSNKDQYGFFAKSVYTFTFRVKILFYRRFRRHARLWFDRDIVRNLVSIIAILRPSNKANGLTVTLYYHIVTVWNNPCTIVFSGRNVFLVFAGRTADFHPVRKE